MRGFRSLYGNRRASCARSFARLAPRQPRQLPAIAFLDLSGFTALAEERGDEAAAEVATGVADVVQDVAVKHGGRPIKWLGDGVMMHFAHPPAAVISGLDLVEETERAISARARVGTCSHACSASQGCTSLTCVWVLAARLKVKATGL